MDININVMDIKADIKWIQKELKEVKDPTFIEAIKNMLQYRKKVSSEERISIEQYNKELDESIADIEAGNYHTHEEVKSMITQWGKR
jgi:predicted transcriptional regulator